MKGSAYAQNAYTKMILAGPPGSGKTTALWSLVNAGYQIRILDFDNGAMALIDMVRQKCPEKLDNIDIIPLRDRWKMTKQGPKLDGRKTRAFIKAAEYVEKWPEDDDTHSNPAEWGPNHILVIDSLTHMGGAALVEAEALNPTVKDRRQIFGGAQAALMRFLTTILGNEFKTHLIVLAHVRTVELDAGIERQIQSIGAALGENAIPSIFNLILLATATRKADGVERQLLTRTNPKLPCTKAYSSLQDSYSQTTGLAEIFAALNSLRQVA